ncbi:lysophospholipid acyltransferase family protein [uncultured Sphaerochaeta sp.]|uniref:lysophospholipid acyltransferase family protein n=1 Tax=uncultured Sphaerochaeta sp. TaxID=886478 RepID=UPI002A0A363A|nr:lysophospholipid acyltransferase family protein [uncultured Sphaerochaeta sp.]
MRYIRLAIAYIIIIPLLFLSVLYAFVPAWILQLFRAKKAANHWLRICGRGISKASFFCLGVTVAVDGRENLPSETNICYVANHLSLLDILSFVGPADLWAYIIAKAELRRVPIVNLWCMAIGCIFIERKNPRSSVKAILDGVNLLKHGDSLLIFPEGTRSKTGRIGELKKGSLKLATRAKAIIVPITIVGTRLGFEDLKGCKRIHASLSIGKPIPTADLTPEEMEDLPQVVYGEISKRFVELSDNT